jgi:hypothetical protein
MEQRANIKFCFKTGKTDTETFHLIKQAYGDNALSLVDGVLNGRQDFGTAVKISKMTKAVWMTSSRSETRCDGNSSGIDFI